MEQSNPMAVFLCTACGTSYPDAPGPRERCPVCEDECQFVPAAGQSWIPRGALANMHRNAWRRHEPGLLSVQTAPALAINQRAFLLLTPEGNVLWDCIALPPRRKAGLREKSCHTSSNELDAY
jgi:hypothetical protein